MYLGQMRVCTYSIICTLPSIFWVWRSMNIDECLCFTTEYLQTRMRNTEYGIYSQAIPKHVCTWVFNLLSIAADRFGSMGQPFTYTYSSRAISITTLVNTDKPVQLHVELCRVHIFIFVHTYKLGLHLHQALSCFFASWLQHFLPLGKNDWKWLATSDMYLWLVFTFSRVVVTWAHTNVAHSHTHRVAGRLHASSHTTRQDMWR